MGLFTSVGQAYRFLCAVYGGVAAWAARAVLQFLAQITGNRRWQRVIADVLFLPVVFALGVAVSMAGLGRPEHFTLPGMICGYVLAHSALGAFAQRLGARTRRMFVKIASSRVFARFVR